MRYCLEERIDTSSVFRDYINGAVFQSRNEAPSRNTPCERALCYIMSLHLVAVNLNSCLCLSSVACTLPGDTFRDDSLRFCVAIYSVFMFA
jgi:hypothetical protein